jgi:hypothetical protein
MGDIVSPVTLCTLLHSRNLQEGEEIIELELSTDELVDVALGINYAQDLDLMLI